MSAFGLGIEIANPYTLDTVYGGVDIGIGHGTSLFTTYTTLIDPL